MTEPDFGTPEMQSRGIRFTGTKESERVAHTITMPPLDIYIGRGWITPDQYGAGKEYHTLWFYGVQKNDCKQMKMGGDTGGTPNYENGIILEEKFRKADKAIRGMVTRLMVFNVCCIGEWAGYLEYVGKNKRMDVLKDGLDDLAKHFSSGRKRV